METYHNGRPLDALLSVSTIEYYAAPSSSI